MQNIGKWQLAIPFAQIEEFRFPNDSGFGVGLQITSQKRANDIIMPAIAELNGIRRLGTNINTGVARLAWAIGARSIYTLLWDGNTLRRNDPQLLLIAKSDGSKAWIETQDENKQINPVFLDNNVHYQIYIEMKGIFFGLGYNLLRCEVVCDLLYNNITDEFTISILEMPIQYLGTGGSFVKRRNLDDKKD